MANVGVPPGGQYPSRAELGAQLRPYMSTPESLGVNQRSTRYTQTQDVYDIESGRYYNPQGFVYGDEEEGHEDEQLPEDYRAPAKLTDVPTSSTNYTRPRTVAAGYDAERQVMTVVFRDGTFYNYYDVTPGEWSNFSASFSKGRPWLNKANSNQSSDGLFIGKARGPANVSEINPEVREQLYRVARTQQIVQRPAYSFSKSFRPNSAPGMDISMPKRIIPGANPAAKRGTNPAQRKRT